MYQLSPPCLLLLTTGVRTGRLLRGAAEPQKALFRGPSSPRDRPPCRQCIHSTQVRRRISRPPLLQKTLLHTAHDTRHQNGTTPDHVAHPNECTVRRAPPCNAVRGDLVT
eukprot:3921344-Prymnesium_polylepis.1